MGDLQSALAAETASISRAWIAAIEELAKLTGATASTATLVEEVTHNGRRAWLQFGSGPIREQYPMAVMAWSGLESVAMTVTVQVLVAAPSESVAEPK